MNEVGEWLAAIVVVTVLLVGSGTLGYQSCEQEWKNKLVEKNLATYVADDKGKVSFVWNNTNEPEEEVREKCSEVH